MNYLRKKKILLVGGGLVLAGGLIYKIAKTCLAEPQDKKYMEMHKKIFSLTEDLIKEESNKSQSACQKLLNLFDKNLNEILTDASFKKELQKINSSFAEQDSDKCTKLFCSHPIKTDEHYYLCMTCNNLGDFNQQPVSEFQNFSQFKSFKKEMGFTILCQDCYKEGKHNTAGNNHDVQEQVNTQPVQLECKCGIQNLFQLKGLCSKHSCSTQQSQILLNLSPNSLQALNNLIATYVLSFIVSVEKQMQKNRRSLTNDLNIYLVSMLQKIRKLVEQNNGLLYAVSQLFIKPFRLLLLSQENNDQELLHDCSNVNNFDFPGSMEGGEEMEKNSAKRCNCSVLQHFIRYNKLYCITALQEFNQLYYKFLMINSQFANHFIVASTDYLRLQLFVALEPDAEGNNAIQNKLMNPLLRQLKLLLQSKSKQEFLMNELKKNSVNHLRVCCSIFQDQVFDENIDSPNYQELILTLLSTFGQLFQHREIALKVLGADNIIQMIFQLVFKLQEFMLETPDFNNLLVWINSFGLSKIRFFTQCAAILFKILNQILIHTYSIQTLYQQIRGEYIAQINQCNKFMFNKMLSYLTNGKQFIQFSELTLILPLLLIIIDSKGIPPSLEELAQKFKSMIGIEQEDDFKYEVNLFARYFDYNFVFGEDRIQGILNLLQEDSKHASEKNKFFFQFYEASFYEHNLFYDASILARQMINLLYSQSFNGQAYFLKYFLEKLSQIQQVQPNNKSELYTFLNEQSALQYNSLLFDCSPQVNILSFYHKHLKIIDTHQLEQLNPMKECIVSALLHLQQSKAWSHIQSIDILDIEQYRQQGFEDVIVKICKQQQDGSKLELKEEFQEQNCHIQFQKIYILLIDSLDQISKETKSNVFSLFESEKPCSSVLSDFMIMIRNQLLISPLQLEKILVLLQDQEKPYARSGNSIITKFIFTALKMYLELLKEFQEKKLGQQYEDKMRLVEQTAFQNNLLENFLEKKLKSVEDELQNSKQQPDENIRENQNLQQQLLILQKKFLEIKKNYKPQSISK